MKRTGVRKEMIYGRNIHLRAGTILKMIKGQMYAILTNLNISTLFHHCLVFVEVKRSKPIIGNDKSTISLDM